MMPMGWKKFPMRYPNRCEACGKALDAGAEAAGHKDPVTNKWHFRCVACMPLVPKAQAEAQPKAEPGVEDIVKAAKEWASGEGVFALPNTIKDLMGALGAEKQKPIVAKKVPSMLELIRQNATFGE